MRCADCPVKTEITCAFDVRGWTKRCEAISRGDSHQIYQAASQSEGQKAESLEAVKNCPSRGPTLPHTLQPDCGCAELSECRAGKGTVPGRVTLQNCIECQGAAQ